MENNVIMPKNQIIWRICLGSLLLVATIIVGIDLFDVSQLLSDFLEISHVTLITAFLFGSASWIFRGIRAGMLFKKSKDQIFSKYIAISFLHNFANNFFPMRLGELVLPLLLKKIYKTPLREGVKGLIGIRILDLLALCIIVLTFFIGTKYFFLGGILFIVFALLVPLFINLFRKFLSTSNIFPIFLFGTFKSDLRAENQGLMPKIWWITVTAWCCKLLGMMILLLSLSNASIQTQTAILLGVELSSILPIHGLAGAGTFEAGGTFGAMISGSDFTIGLKSSIQLHLYVLSLTVLFGIIGIMILILGNLYDKKSS